MGLSPSAASLTVAVPAPVLAHLAGGLVERAWQGWVREQVEEALRQVLVLPDEARLDTRWSEALESVREYTLRPAKRVRPALVVAGWCLAQGRREVPAGLWRVAAGLELMHTFLLVHDDVADRAELRRGGPSLHRLLAPGREGEDLAVVVGDHLFALALEAMLGSGLPRAGRMSQYYLGVCRHTAAGQYLDLGVSRTPLSEVKAYQALRVAWLKTARYGFSAPLVCGAMLAGGDVALLGALERVGRHVGLAYQLRDDVLGLYGEEHLCGKPVDGDFLEGKRTFPVVAAWVRASPEQRAELEALWALPAERKDAATLERARGLVEACGGRAATERLVERSTRAARKAMATLPEAEGMRALLEALVLRLAHRTA